MRLAPLFNSAGKLLGHVDLNRCIMSRDSYTVDERGGQFTDAVWESDTEVKDTIRFFRFPLKRFKFRWGKDESIVRYMVVDERIPDWVWKAAGIKFNGAEDWERNNG